MEEWMGRLEPEWDAEKNAPLLFRDMTRGISRKVWWKCKFGHEWLARFSNRVQGTECPACRGKRLSPNWNLAVCFPNIATEWHPSLNGNTTPEMVLPHSNKSAWWLCKEGHEWQARINNRTSGETGCPICNGNGAPKGERDLNTMFPEIAKQWHPNKNGDLGPSMVMPHHNGRVWWMCEKGHEWQVSPNNRMAGCGCPFCNQHRLIPEETSLTAVRPDIAAQWDYEKNDPDTPGDVTAYSNKKYWWRCDVGHRWMATVANRSYGEECPDCLNRKRRKRRYLP